MHQVRRVPGHAVNQHPVFSIGIADRHKGDTGGSNRFQASQITLVGMRNNNGIPAAIKQHIHHNGGHPVRPGHIAVRLNIQQPGKLILDSDVTLLGIAHQVYGHAADQLSDP